MRNLRQVWILNNRLRQDESYNYKKAKSVFRCNLRKPAHEFENAESQKLYKQGEMDQNAFWRAVNSKRANNPHVSEMKFEHETLKFMCFTLGRSQHWY